MTFIFDSDIESWLAGIGVKKQMESTATEEESEKYCSREDGSAVDLDYCNKTIPRPQQRERARARQRENRFNCARWINRGPAGWGESADSRKRSSSCPGLPLRITSSFLLWGDDPSGYINHHYFFELTRTQLDLDFPLVLVLFLFPMDGKRGRKGKGNKLKQKEEFEVFVNPTGASPIKALNPLPPRIKRSNRSLNDHLRTFTRPYECLIQIFLSCHLGPFPPSYWTEPKNNTILTRNPHSPFLVPFSLNFHFAHFLSIREWRLG